jgi:hypothetical protein
MCGRSENATYRVNPVTGTPGWVIGCFKASCQTRSYLPDLAEHLDLPRGADKDAIVAELRRRSNVRSGSQRGMLAALPSLAALDGWVSRLWSTPDALAYLRDERGLTDKTIRAAGIGYGTSGNFFRRWIDVKAFVLPVYRDGELVNVRRRFWPDPAINGDGEPVKVAGLRRPAALYPGDPGKRWLLVCEGEFDALILRQHRFPAVTSTASTSWDPAWDRIVVGKKVVVMYDAGSLDKARRRAEGFEAAGARAAVPVDLSVAGMGHGEDATDWFVKYGQSADDLRDLIRDARRSA